METLKINRGTDRVGDVNLKLRKSGDADVNGYLWVPAMKKYVHPEDYPFADSHEKESKRKHNRLRKGCYIISGGKDKYTELKKNDRADMRVRVAQLMDWIVLEASEDK